jgi:hypothetical protein
LTHWQRFMTAGVTPWPQCARVFSGKLMKGQVGCLSFCSCAPMFQKECCGSTIARWSRNKMRRSTGTSAHKTGSNPTPATPSSFSRLYPTLLNEPQRPKEWGALSDYFQTRTSVWLRSSGHKLPRQSSKNLLPAGRPNSSTIKLLFEIGQKELH